MPKKTPSTPDMMQLGMDAWRLWADASSVIMLRSARMMQGGAVAQREAKLMVDEKMEAGATLGVAMWPLLASGAAPQVLAKAAIGHYQQPVGANRRRLTQAKR